MFEDPKKRGKLIQLAAAVFASSGSIIFGICMGWPSPLVPVLTSEETYLPSGPLTIDEVSLVSSIMAWGGLFGALFFGWMSHQFGRKWPIVISSVPHVVAYILMLIAKNVNFLYVSRFLSGISGGALFVLGPTYVCEISENSIRGALGTIHGIFDDVGYLIAIPIYSYMSFHAATIVVLIIETMLFVFIIFPESPHYLILKHRDEEAEKSLMFFRAASHRDQVKEEFEEIKASITANQTKDKLCLQDFMPSTTRKAMLIAFILVQGQNFSGIFSIKNYVVSIFEEAGNGLDPNVAAVSAAAIELVGALASAYTTDKAGRRVLLLTSLFGAAFFYTILGIYFLLNHLSYNLTAFFWLPVICLSGILFISPGIFDTPVYIMTELLPTKIRSIVTTVYETSTWPGGFLIIQYYMSFVDLIGAHTCMWIFGGWCLFEGIFSYYWLPETKGKNANEIVQALAGKAK